MADLDLQEELETVREQLLVAIETLPDEALIEPNGVGEWAVVDVLANLAAWEAELVTGLMQIDAGRKPARLLQNLADLDGFNATCYAENKERDLDAIFDDFQRVRVELEGWIESFKLKELHTVGRYKWLPGRTLAQLIAQVSYEREASYIAALTQFAANWRPAGVIDLLSIPVMND